MIGGNSVRYEFPKDFFVPDQWFFYCFAYNNGDKKLEVYLNSEKIFNKKITKHLDSFVIYKDFLQYEKFGTAGYFAGKFTDLNIWSRILKDSEILELYKCKVLDKGPDIVDWTFSQPVPGNNVIVSEERTHPCIEITKHESKTMTFDVAISMEPARKPLRVCNAIGGTMKAPTNMKDVETILEKCEDPECFVWVPIFKASEEKWVDRENKVVHYTPWAKGQPNGGNYEKCAMQGSTGFGAGYRDVGCERKFNFYCNIKDFQVFQLKGMCEEKETSIDRKYVLRLKDNVNTRPVWQGFLSNNIEWNNNKTRWEIIDTGNSKTIASLRKKSSL